MKNLLQKKKASGFTIIEVVIVLAIAGLIMVIVFIAIPQLQRNQRDNARQNVANRVEAEMETFAGNNQGAYPLVAGAGNNFETFTNNYFGPMAKNNPRTGVAYTIALATAYADNPTPGQILVYRDATCNGEVAAGGTITNTTSRQIALRLMLDNGTTYYCVDNS